MQQIPLPLGHDSAYDEADFIAGHSNADCLEWLRHTGRWPDRRLLLTGPAGSGKTHMLHNWVARHGGALLLGPALKTWPAPPAQAIAVDDADQAAEQPLLHLINQAATARIPLLLAARMAPRAWRIGLPDLRSRLMATHKVSVGQADDALLERLLIRLMAERQMRLNPASCAYLLARLPRDAAALREAVAMLDRMGLATGGPITRPMLARAVMALGDDGTSKDGTSEGADS